MVASQNVDSQQQNADMYCTHYGEYYPDNSQYYMHGPTPELCHAHVCAVQGEFGPVTVPMVSTNSSPPIAMPVQVPPGHVVQQIVDESGTLRHVILSPQHPAGLVHLPSHNTQHYGAGNGTNQQFYQSLATGFPPPPHYHSSIPPGHPAGPSPTAHLGHSPPPPPPQQPSTTTTTSTNQSTTHYKDERTQKQYIKLKKKIHDKKLDNMKKELVNGFKRTTPTNLNKENSNKEMNSVGTSEDGEESSIADEEDSVQIVADILSSVQAPKVSELSSRSALLQWAPPTRLSETATNNNNNNSNNNNNNDNNSSSINDIDLSDLRYEVLLSDKSKEMKFKSIYSGCSLSCRIQDLRPGQEYSVCLQVHYEEMQGTATDPVKFLTPPCEPDQPLPPKLHQRQKNSLHLRWNHCNDNGAPIKHYLLEYDDGRNNGDFIELYRGKVKQHIVSKLQPSTSYKFRLAAINDCGKSKYSDIVIYNTLNNPPLKPQPPNLLEKTINSLYLKWNYRVNDDEFTLQMADSKTDYYMAVYNGKDTEYLCKDLDCFTNYKFRLRVENDGGISPWSEEVEYKTLPDRPGRPSKPIVKGRIHAYSFKLKWEPPQNNGGAQIDEYILEINSGSGYEKIYNGIETEAICDKLTPGTTYQLRVSCISTGGVSNYSDPCTVTTEAINPGQCSIPKLIGKPKANSITIKWYEPDYNGGAPILEYEVEMLTLINSSRQIIYKNKQQECTINNNNLIKPGHDYIFTVRAVNRIGPGIWSEQLKVTSGPAPPEQPQTPIISCKSPFHLFIEWQQPNCNGAPINEYRLEMSTLNDNEDNFQCIYQGSELFYDIKGLTPFTTYYFRVQASNSAGFSPFSLPSVTITPAAPPSQITTIRSESTPTTIKLYWQEPINNGSPILYYNIEIGDKLIKTETSLNEYTITNLQPDTLYKIKVQAINTIGCGSYSSTIKIATLRLPPPPPKLECVSYGHNYLKLKWGDGKNIDYTQYQLELENIRTHEFQCIYKGTSFIYKLNKLNELTIYKFRINAINDAGIGDYSDIYEFQTSIAPPNVIKSPKIIDIEQRSCTLEWLSSRNSFPDPIIYQVQLSKAKDQHFKQVYKGNETKCYLDNLEPGTDYNVRVCPIRLTTNNGELQGVWSSIVNFTTIPETTTLSKVTTTLHQQQHHHQQHHHHHHHKNRNLLSLIQHTVRLRTLSDQPFFYAFLVVIVGILISFFIIWFF